MVELAEVTFNLQEGNKRGWRGKDEISVPWTCRDREQDRHTDK